ncbi:MAG TPA: multiple monosaccharide ABC transporter substrate-binding protein [Caproiciproducens sp.]|nr:multiple monosaccharide ABC transporter substrate-binding protein [Caproiciproducens sp.]
MKKLLAFVLAAALSLTAFGCSAAPAASTAAPAASAAPAESQAASAAAPASAASAGGLVGVAMPTKSLQRWNEDGANMKKALEAKGYQVELQYAENDVNTQVSQIENMITKKVKVLVIASIDGSALTDVLQQAADNGIKVIAYDRLIMKSKNVDYYATFDNYKVGTIQGQFLEDKLGLKDGKGPFNIEIFAGSPDDNNAVFFNNGAMDVLNPYIKSGKLVVKSGQTDFKKCAIQSWKSETAQARMDNLLTANYANGTKLDAVLSPNDSLAIGVVAALKNIGYNGKDKPFPILTGQDCDKPNVVAMINGEQSMSVFKDTRTLADKVVGMVDSILQGKDAEVNDTKTYNNGEKVVPSFLCDPVAVTKDNYKKVLIDSGYYKEADLKK